MPQGRVLVVDDEPDTRQLLGLLLRHWGLDVVTASNGAEALRLLSVHPVDVVLTDLCMPGMDGVELVRRLKTAPGLDQIPVIATSALPQLPQALEDSLEAFLRKPLDFERLRAALSPHLAGL
jgi:CheY-like chemotaxis protein